MFVQGQNTTLTVIGNLVGAPAELNQSQLKSIFMGETPKWSNGTKVVLALMKTNTEVGKLTCSKVYNKSSEEVTKFWLSQAIGGNVEAPSFFNTVAELQAFVSGKPGAIGIIDLTTTLSGVRVVLIDRKRGF